MSDVESVELQGDGYQIVLDGFDDADFNAKGYFCGATLKSEGKDYKITFYDKVRLYQTIEDDLLLYGVFSESNLVVVPEISPASFLGAINYIIKYNDLDIRFAATP